MRLLRALPMIGGALLLTSSALGQNVLFDFNNGPEYTGTPLYQHAGNILAKFDGSTAVAYSIQNTANVIGVLPTGFSGLGLCPDSVFGADLYVSFYDDTFGLPLDVSAVSILVAPQELACDSSSTMQIRAYEGTNLVGSNTAKAPSDLNTYTWPTITLGFSSTVPFNNVVIHFLSGPPTGGDWGGIFAADNLTVTPVAAPEPVSVMLLGIGALALLKRRSA